MNRSIPWAAPVNKPLRPEAETACGEAIKLMLGAFDDDRFARDQSLADCFPALASWLAAHYAVAFVNPVANRKVECVSELRCRQTYPTSPAWRRGLQATGATRSAATLRHRQSCPQRLCRRPWCQ
jgi:hypothetical protein